MGVINGWKDLTRNPVCFFWEAATPCRFPNLQAVERNVMGSRVAGGSRLEGVDSARFDPPEFFSVPSAPFLAARNVATYRDSIFFGVAVGPRGDPWGPVGTRGDPRLIAGPVFTGTLWIHGRY